jgi:Na+/H+ antiporter NhaD/arsenite permease-like protein
MIPILFRKTWNTKLTDLKTLPHPKINHPRMVILGGFITVFMLTFFIIGDSLPIPVSPAAVALLGAALAMLLSHHSHIDSVNNILKDVDWSTLLFFMSIFVLIGGLDKTGVLAYFINFTSS